MVSERIGFSFFRQNAVYGVFVFLGRVASNNYDTETALVESFKMTPKLF